MVVKTKVCSHCGKKKDSSFFYKKSCAKDGLQDWCKECQGTTNALYRLKIEDRKYHSFHERLRYYKNNYGLSYQLLKDDKSSNKKGKLVKFNCLKCGKEITCSLGTAAVRRFVCDKCSNTISRYNPRTNKKIQHISCTENIKKSNSCLISKKQNDLVQEIKKHYPNSNIVITFESYETKYPISTTTSNSTIEHLSCKCSKKKGLFNWIKNLFKKK